MTNSMVRSPCPPAHVWDYLWTAWLQGTVRTHRAIAWDPSVWLWSPKTVSKVPNCPPPSNTQEFSFLHMLAKTGVMRNCFLLIQWVINGIFLLFVFSWLLLRCLLIYVGFPLCGWPIHILWPFRKIAVLFFKKRTHLFSVIIDFFFLLWKLFTNRWNFAMVCNQDMCKRICYHIWSNAHEDNCQIP